MRKIVKKLIVSCAVVGILGTGGAAWATWRAKGVGTNLVAGTAGTALPLVVESATFQGTLTPGAQTDLTIEVKNPNTFSAGIYFVKLLAATSDKPALCTGLGGELDTGLTLITPTGAHDDILFPSPVPLIPANDSRVVTVKFGMGEYSADGCQGAKLAVDIAVN